MCVMLLAGNAFADPKILKDQKAPPGYDMTLFAAPPQVNYPTCVTATPRGELFVGIDDQGSLGKESDRGRIVRCVDTNNDGVADRITAFTKIDHPRGLAWDDATGALYVLHPPTLSRYYDDDRDGVADRSEALVTDLGNHKATAQQGADHTTNGIRLGIDGWIYIAVGDFGIIDGVGSDGKRLTLHGGGIVRVRTDGSGLETYASGMRNIYDVAIDPQLNVFTRDNTNDGNGWNDRVTYSPPTAYHGYPNRFRRFPEEIVDCILDTGAGSPCGVLFVDEPSLPEPHRHALFTVEWGQNRVDRHPLTASGASFKASTEHLMDVPRGIDVDVDGVGRLYVASWANGSFSYSDPNVGYVVRLTPKGAAPSTFPDLRRASGDELLAHLGSPSGVRRQAAQREMLRRGDEPAVAEGLTKLAASDAPLAGRIAALFTLKLLRGPAADATLVQLWEKQHLREFALRALADRKGDANVPAAPLVSGLTDSNPRVRLMSAWGLGRLARRDAAGVIVPLTIDPDPVVAHVAVNALVDLQAADACLAAMSDGNEKLAAGVANALQQMHEPAVVDGLLARLEQAKEPAVRTQIFRALTRLHSREKDWDGDWWQTRPDTTGPYFQPVAWSATPRIADVIRRALTTEPPQTVRALLIDCGANRVDLPEVNERLLAVAPKDSPLCLALLDTLVRRQQLSDREIAAAKAIMTSPAAEPAIRVKTIQVLTWEWAGDAAIEAVIEALGHVATAGGSPPAALAAELESFTRDPQLARRVPLLARVAAGTEAAPAGRREVALAALTAIAQSKLTEPEPRAAAEAALAALRPPAVSATRQAASVPSAETIGSIGFEKALATMLKTPGDAKLGKDLFTRQGCVACHTVSQDEPPRGPFLGGIATRYSRTELIESILRPSAKIAQGFETQWFKTKGNVIEGFVTRDAGDEIELRDASGKTIVLKKDQVNSRGKRDKSVMPEGLLSNLSPAEAASLVAYLESLKGK